MGPCFIWPSSNQVPQWYTPQHPFGDQKCSLLSSLSYHSWWAWRQSKTAGGGWDSVYFSILFARAFVHGRPASEPYTNSNPLGKTVSMTRSLQSRVIYIVSLGIRS